MCRHKWWWNKLLIQTYERGYKVISHVLTNNLGDIYICRDIATGFEYTLLCIRDRVIVPGLMVYLNTGMRKESFVDYIEHFVFEDKLCLVLKYYRGNTLFEKLHSEHCSLNERMKIGKKIIDRIIFLDMPLYFLKNCLTGEHVIVRPNLDVFFNYLPRDICNFAAVDNKAVLNAFSAVFSLLFADELSKQSAPPINQFYSALHEVHYFNSIELYKQYAEMCREVELIPEDELNKPKSKWFLFWERVKRRFVVIKKILAIALFILAVAYLSCTVKEFIDPTITHVKNFEFIGTLEIEGVQ